uniref:EF-hand calcium binding domain 12 n=1 Tax=Strigops habroptila TaxID=2489341 RepID=A0A672UZN5_STRHB
ILFVPPVPRPSFSLFDKDLQTAEAWTQARRQLRTELENLGNIKRWLRQKPFLSSQEQLYLQRIKAQVFPNPFQHPQRKGRKKSSIPLVCAPYPQALVTLQSLLQKKTLNIVDVFKAAGLDGMKIKRADFIKVIKEVYRNRKVMNPLGFNELALGSEQPPCVLGCSKRSMSTTSKTATSGATGKGMKLHPPTTLEVPAVNVEPEERHPSYDDMEEIGKNLRERKRREKVRVPIEWKEKSRLVRCGDGPVDEHCLPSTLEPGLGELVDQYRRNTVLSYLASSKLCREHNVPIFEPTLQKGLLHPGDKIIKVGEHVRKIRQPGGYYTTGRVDALSLARYCLLSVPPPCFHRLLQRSKIQKTSENRFWPGHLLDKLCLYFPDKQHDRAHALFSYVSPTNPLHPGYHWWWELPS